MLVDLMRYMAARYPRHSWTGDVVKCRDSTWVAVCEVIPTIWVWCCSSQLDRGKSSISLLFDLRLSADQQMRSLEMFAHHTTSLNEEISKNEYRCNVKACSMVLQRTHLERGEEELAVGSEGLAVFSKVKSDQCDTQFAADMARMSTRRAIRDPFDP